MLIIEAFKFEEKTSHAPYLYKFIHQLVMLSWNSLVITLTKPIIEAVEAKALRVPLVSGSLSIKTSHQSFASVFSG